MNGQNFIFINLKILFQKKIRFIENYFLVYDYPFYFYKDLMDYISKIILVKVDNFNEVVFH